MKCCLASARVSPSRRNVKTNKPRTAHFSISRGEVEMNAHLFHDRVAAFVRKARSKLRVTRWNDNEEPHKTMIELDFINAVFLMLLIGAAPIALGAELFRLAGLWGFLLGELAFVFIATSVVYYEYGDERPKRE
jgi:hypothetical protein